MFVLHGPLKGLTQFRLHVHKHHEAPAKSPHQKHGDVHAVDDQVVEHTEVQAPVPQQKQNNWQFVLQAQEHTYADVLQEEDGWEEHPEQGGQQTAAEVKQEAEEAVHAARAQVQVEVVILGAHQLGCVRRPTGWVHAGGVGAMKAAHPPWDGDHRHGWATGAQRGPQVWQERFSGRAASWEAVIHLVLMTRLALSVGVLEWCCQWVFFLIWNF